MRFFSPVFLFFVVSVIFLLLYCGLPFAAFAMDLHVLCCLQATADTEEFDVYFFALVNFFFDFFSSFLPLSPPTALRVNCHEPACAMLFAANQQDFFGWFW